jgi:hypothetical protein
MKRMLLAMVGLGCVLFTLAAWILAAEVVRPNAIIFTTDPASAGPIYAKRDAAVTAARVGLVRGDLWSEAAFASGSMLWSQENNKLNGPQVERARSVTETAIAYAPHDSRLWLLLAAEYFRLGGPNERSTVALKMSYYTGSNMLAVLPKRLELALQGPALEDDEFRELVRHDLRIAISHKPQLTMALVEAYKGAPSSGRQFMETTLAELDPSVLESIRAAAR